MRMRTARLLLAAMALLAAPWVGAAPDPASSAAGAEREVGQLLDKYCYTCHGRGKHKGDLAMDDYPATADKLKAPKVWELVLHHVHTGEMPPDDKPQPTPAERERITQWLEDTLFHFDPAHPDPGRVTIRRLNRAEYNLTVRDLLGVDFRPADDFPVDDSGYGAGPDGANCQRRPWRTCAPSSVSPWPRRTCSPNRACATNGWSPGSA